MEELKDNMIGESAIVDRVDRGSVWCLIYDDGTIEYAGPYRCYCSNRHAPVWSADLGSGRIDTTYRVAGRGIDFASYTRAMQRIAYKKLVVERDQLKEEIERLQKKLGEISPRIERYKEVYGEDYLTGRFGVPHDW